MTSRISYSKYIRQNIRQRGWLAAASSIGALLLIPLYTLMYLSKLKVSMTFPQMLSWAQTMFPRLLNGRSNLLLVGFIGLMGLVCAVTGYSYLHSKVKQDFFHSMPVTRGQWFMISYFGGLLIFLVPYIIACGLTLIIGRAFLLMTPGILGDSMITMLSGILMFLIVYHLSIFAMMLTGQTVTGVLAAGTLFVYQYLVLIIVNVMAEIFFDTWTSFNFDSIQKLVSISPVSLFAEHLLLSENMIDPWKCYLYTFLLLAVLIAASYVLCRRYPAESAENALSFRKTAPVIKIMVSVPCALAICYIVNMFMGDAGKYWFYFIGILSVLLLCCVIEFIYHHDLKMILKNRITTLLSIILTVIIICIFDFDLIGYDTYIPEENELESISFSDSTLEDYFMYSPYFGEEQGLITSTDVAALLPVAENGVKNIENTEADVLYAHVQMRYNLKNGKTKYRTYVVDSKVMADVITHLSLDPEFRKDLFPVFKIKSDQIDDISLVDIYSQNTDLDLKQEQFVKLIDAYKKDLLETDIDVLIKQTPIGHLNIYSDTSWDTSEIVDKYKYRHDRNSSMEFLYIFDTFTHSLEILEEFGYPVRTHIDASDVQHISFTSGEFIPEDDRFIASTNPPEIIKDRQEIQEVLDHLKYNYSGGFLSQKTFASENVIVTFNEGYDAFYRLY